MKLLHIADTHLGFSAYRKVTDEGINQREQDVYDAFRQFIDYALKSKPDLIVHAGDLFDSVRPTNRALTFALQQILRLSNKGIPFVVIAGNHEHPKLKETGHIFRIFDHIDHVYPVYTESYETHAFTFDNEKIMIHAIPQCSTKDKFNALFKKVKPDSSADYNLLMVHGAVKGIQEFSMNEFNELMIPDSHLNSQFEYIALGHYHKYTKLRENAFFTGSTESFSFADAGEQKGFIEIDVTHTLKHQFIPLKIRTMVDTATINCSRLTIAEIMKRIKNAVTQIKPDGKIIRIILTDIPVHIYRGIDFRAIKEFCASAVHYEIKATMSKDEKTTIAGSTKIGALSSEFKQFLRGQNVAERNTLFQLGIEYIEKIEEKQEVGQ